MTKLDTIIRPFLLGLVLLGTLGLASCNTMEGAGQDIEAAGDSISDTAEDTEDEM